MKIFSDITSFQFFEFGYEDSITKKYLYIFCSQVLGVW